MRRPVTHPHPRLATPPSLLPSVALSSPDPLHSLAPSSLTPRLYLTPLTPLLQHRVCPRAASKGARRGAAVRSQGLRTLVQGCTALGVQRVAQHWGNSQRRHAADAAHAQGLVKGGRHPGAGAVGRPVKRHQRLAAQAALAQELCGAHHAAPLARLWVLY